MGGPSERAILVGPRIVSVLEKGDEKLKAAFRGTGREIVSRRFSLETEPGEKNGPLNASLSGKIYWLRAGPYTPSLPKISLERKMVNRRSNSIVPRACIEGRRDCWIGEEEEANE